MYRPNLFSTPAKLLIPTQTKINGIITKSYTEGETIYVSAKSYGGTENFTNNILTIIDTMVIETWYNPNITSDCKLKLLDDNSEWEIISTPENIDRRNQYLKFKIKRIKGEK